MGTTETDTKKYIEIRGHKFLYKQERRQDEKITYLGVSIDSVVDRDGSGVIIWKSVGPSYRVPLDVRDALEEYFRKTEQFFGHIDWWYLHPQRDI